MEGQDITAGLIPAPFGLPLEGGGMAVPSGFGSGNNSAPLMSVRVTDNEGTKSDSVELEIDNRERHRAPKPGSMLQVWLGLQGAGGLKYMGRYKVDGWSKSGGLRKMTVSAKAAELTTDIKAGKSRSYHDTTVGEIVKKVAGKHNLSAQVHPDLAKIKIAHLDQSGESDLAFLTRLAKRVGANFKPADGKAIFTKAGSGQLPGGGAAPVFTITEQGSGDWTATGSERGDYGSAAASWQNVETGEREWENEGEGKPKHRDRKLYKTKVEAQAAAKAQLAALKRGKVSVSLPVVGRVELFAGAKANLVDFDPDVDGLYLIKTCTHTLDSEGLKTTLTLESGEGGDEKSDEE